MDAIFGLSKLVEENLAMLPFDAIAICTIDFQNGKLQACEWKDGKKISGQDPYWYDLASITKPLTLGGYALLKDFELKSELELLIDHRSGLIFWGLLAKDSWRDQLRQYPIAKSQTVYSDFGALRAMLEIEINEQKPLYSIVKKFWDKHVCFWKELPQDARTHITGFRDGKDISREVHDPNAYCLETPLSHAGLFATPQGLGQTLINYDRNFGLMEKMQKILLEDRKRFDRFVWSWDTPEGAATTAGSNAGKTVFGHLGFVGNSVWMDAQQKKGLILFTNQSRYAWYERTALNQLRRLLYSSFWEMK